MLRSGLSDTKIRAAKATGSSYKLSDGLGLHLLITPRGSKLWRYRYRLNGMESMYSLGEYPIVSLQEARRLRDHARRLVEEGIRPSEFRAARKREAATSRANTFRAIAEEWIEDNRNRWSEYYLKQVRSMLQADVMPLIGNRPIRELHASDLLAILKSVEKRGASTVALLLRQWCSAIFRYAIATLRADVDPAIALRGAVKRKKVKHKAAMSAKEIAIFLDALDHAPGTEDVRIGLKVLMLTFVRPGELRRACLSEFDLDKREWRIPAERMKMRSPHIVPLSTQACDLIRPLISKASGELLFPNVRNASRPMSLTTFNRFLERMGYAGKLSAHGFRATASTNLNELGFSSDLIERQLAHQERNSVRASYNHAAYLAERASMMQQWADLVDKWQAEQAMAQRSRNEFQ